MLRSPTLLVALCSIAVFFLAAAEPPLAEDFPIAGEKPWMHEPSQIAFEHTAEGFVRTNGTKYHADPENVSVAYEHAEARVTATVYVYPNHGGDLIEHFREVAADIHKSWDDVHVLRAVKIETEGGGQKREAAVGEFTFEPKGGGATRYSAVYVYKHGKYFVKFRMTAEDGYREALSKVMSKFFSAALNLPKE